METILTWLAVTLAGLLVSAHTVVHLPVLAVVAVGVVLALAAGVLLAAWLLVRDGLRLRPRAAAL